MDVAYVWSEVLLVGLDVALLAAGGDTIRAYLYDYEISSSTDGMSSSTVTVENVGPL